MASSSHPSRDRGKAIVVVRNAYLFGWISDEETHLEFLRWTKFKHIVPHKYLNLDLFEKEGFHFQEWIETQETNRWLKKKDVYSNWLRFPGRYTIERLYVHEGLNKEEKIIAHILAWVILLARPVQERITTGDVFLLYAIKNGVPTNLVEVIKDHMIDAGTKHAVHLPYVVFINKILTLQGVDVSGEKKFSCNCSNGINRNTLTSIGLVKTTKG
ncbi:hypothetical protein LR48_Vigan04g129800 [Vigna angularis]|uniref:Uncharacterized protein n=1 Tax=Phaseolus angularis TaxID=3914 RepID=A0A0L9UDV1_PHAAN|nr:hypothetical protein LR48_Vigan04g129800 [Vigna angularis]